MRNGTHGRHYWLWVKCIRGQCVVTFIPCQTNVTYLWLEPKPNDYTLLLLRQNKSLGLGLCRMKNLLLFFLIGFLCAGSKSVVSTWEISEGYFDLWVIKGVKRGMLRWHDVTHMYLFCLSNRITWIKLGGPSLVCGLRVH